MTKVINAEKRTAQLDMEDARSKLAEYREESRETFKSIRTHLSDLRGAITEGDAHARSKRVQTRALDCVITLVEDEDE